MFAVSCIDINMILNMNIWSAQQNDNSNERAPNHTNLIISYRFGLFLEFNFEIDDFLIFHQSEVSMLEGNTAFESSSRP